MHHGAGPRVRTGGQGADALHSQRLLTDQSNTQVPGLGVMPGRAVGRAGARVSASCPAEQWAELAPAFGCQGGCRSLWRPSASRLVSEAERFAPAVPSARIVEIDANHYVITTYDDSIAAIGASWARVDASELPRISNLAAASCDFALQDHRARTAKATAA